MWNSQRDSFSVSLSEGGEGGEKKFANSFPTLNKGPGIAILGRRLILNLVEGITLSRPDSLRQKEGCGGGGGRGRGRGEEFHKFFLPTLSSFWKWDKGTGG